MNKLKLKKKSILICLFILLFSLTTGCLDKTNNSNNNELESNNIAPIPILKAPENAYFGESIEFDASESYDEDGKIISYNWDFGDGNNSEGILQEHTYIFDNNFESYLPIIFTVILYIEDNQNTVNAIDHRIKLYPKEYNFYLSSGSLTTETPPFNKELLENSGFQKIKTYSLEKPITIQKCKWNATLYLEKPLFLRATKINIILYDSVGEKIIQKEENLGLTSLWTTKIIKITGLIENNEEFLSIKIIISGFSIRNNINIICGGEKASNICFDFTS